MEEVRGGALDFYSFWYPNFNKHDLSCAGLKDFTDCTGIKYCLVQSSSVLVYPPITLRGNFENHKYHNRIGIHCHVF